MIQQEDKHQPVRKDFLVYAHFEISSPRAKGENAYCKQRIRTAWGRREHSFHKQIILCALSRIMSCE